MQGYSMEKVGVLYIPLIVFDEDIEKMAVLSLVLSLKNGCPFEHPKIHNLTSLQCNFKLSALLYLNAEKWMSF